LSTGYEFRRWLVKHCERARKRTVFECLDAANSVLYVGGMPALVQRTFVLGTKAQVRWPVIWCRSFFSFECVDVNP
jgi:hypothetical protein